MTYAIAGTAQGPYEEQSSPYEPFTKEPALEESAFITRKGYGNIEDEIKEQYNKIPNAIPIDQAFFFLWNDAQTLTPAIHTTTGIIIDEWNAFTSYNREICKPIWQKRKLNFQELVDKIIDL